MIFCRTQNYGDSEKSSGCPKTGGEEWIGGAQTIFRAVKLLSDTIMVDTCDY